jgi:Tannase and feruloyl esterase
LLNSVPSPVGGATVATELDVDDAAAAIAANPRTALTDTVSTDLSTFSGHGGKLIFYHGLSDRGFRRSIRWLITNVWGKSPIGAGFIWYRAWVIARVGPRRPVVDWVEKGIAPDSITATGKAFPGRSRPLCAWPKYAWYKGKGDWEDAKNFECRE